MKIQITNREIFFAVESVWEQLNYKLRYQINQLVTANSDDSYVQEVDVDAVSFIQVMKATSNQPQGVAKDINPPMHLSLKGQILSIAGPVMQHLSTLTDVDEIDAYKLESAEILIIAEAVQLILDENEAMLNNKLLNGKTQILS